MEALPAVPDVLPQPRDREIVDLAGTEVVRLFTSAGPHPLRWNEPRLSPQPRARFDPHGGTAVGVWYAAFSMETAVAEFFQETRTVARDASLVRVCIARLTTARLLDLGSRWSTRAGCGSQLIAARHEETQRWAAAIRSTFAALDGLVWPSSVDPPGRALVLWTAAGAAPPLEPFPLLNRDIYDQPIAATIAAAAESVRYGYEPFPVI